MPVVGPRLDRPIWCGFRVGIRGQLTLCMALLFGRFPHDDDVAALESIRSRFER